jgi:hypothetical protein
MPCTYTRGSEKEITLSFYFMLFTSWTCLNFRELHYNITEGMVVLNIFSILVDSLLHPLNKIIYASTAATRARRSAVHRQWGNVVVGFFKGLL